ncbi:MAG: right-handed parallel beta-helix repeat-containing protein [Bacteroidales bacterium]|nr:right-handed parallel beta-helix repeat-containing protein [Bacteroidales bacterium]
MKTIMLILISTLFYLNGFCQQNYYVNTAGNDDTGDGSYNLPWQTIQNGMDQLSAGDTLNIMAGTYNEKLFVEVSGTNENKIVIRNNSNDTVIISGADIIDSEAVIEIYNQSNITIEGLFITNNEMPDSKGILIEAKCNNITIRNNKIYNINFSNNATDVVTEETNAQPLIVFGTESLDPVMSLIIEGNKIYDCRTGYSEALAINGNVDGFEVVNNTVHNITNIGIDIIGHEGTSLQNDQARNGLVKGNTIYNCISAYATSGGIYVDGGKDLVIENNVSYHNGYGIEIGCENTGKTTSNVVVRDNLFYDNEVCAIAIGGFDYPDGSGKVVDCDILNNTCMKNDFAVDGTGEMYITYLENANIKNNIFYISGQNIFAYAELSQVNLVMDYNLFYSLSGNFETDWNGTQYASFSVFQTGTGSNANSLFSDPLLVSADVLSADFHLQENSPAINAGDPDFVAGDTETDFYGNERVFDNRVDCGAYECQTSSEVSKIKTAEDIVIFPNPCSSVLNVRLLNNKTAKGYYYTIMNNLGQTISKGKMESNQISLNGFSRGSYQLIILDSEYQPVHTVEFIKN